MNTAFDFGDARLPDRFWDKIIPEPNTGCWLWTAYLDKQGYGQYNHKGKMQLAHRVVMNELIGSMDGLVSDHLCRTTACVNPLHLEGVDISTNTRRGHSWFRVDR